MYCLVNFCFIVWFTVLISIVVSEKRECWGPRERPTLKEHLFKNVISMSSHIKCKICQNEIVSLASAVKFGRCFSVFRGS